MCTDQRLHASRWCAIPIGEVVLFQVRVAESEAALVALVLQALAALRFRAHRDRVRALARATPGLVLLDVSQLASALRARAHVHVLGAALAVTLAERLPAVDARCDRDPSAGTT